MSSEKYEYLQNYGEFKVIEIKSGKMFWHGTTANISEINGTIQCNNKWQPDFIKENKPFYLTNKKNASSYGTKKDTSRLVSVIKHDYVRGTSSVSVDKIVPLYYIKGFHGIDIQFKIKNSLKLLDIGDIDNIKKIIEILNNTSNSKKKREYEHFIDILNNTCFNGVVDETTQKITVRECFRKSTELFDPDLVNFVCNKFYSKISLFHIDGWIYKEGSTLSRHHTEILLCNPKDNLEYISTDVVPDTIYDPSIPTWDEFVNSRPKYDPTLYAKNDIKLIESSTDINVSR